MDKQLTPEQQIAVFKLRQTNKRDLIKALRASGVGLPTYYSEHTKLELVDWIKREVDPVKVYRSVEQLKHKKGENNADT